jgi:predicted metal-dependent hydrolase
VSKKSGHIAARIEQFRDQEFDAHYLGYFDCFNRQLFYEAHDVLEELWLADRRGPDGDFYKGLIQLAGAFVHVQKDRRGPAQALLRLAEANLEKYPPRHHELNLNAVLSMIREWFQRLDEPGGAVLLLQQQAPPELRLDRVGGIRSA